MPDQRRLGVYVCLCVYTSVCTGLCRLRGGLAVHPEEGGDQGVQGEEGGREVVVVVLVVAGGGCPPPGDEP